MIERMDTGCEGQHAVDPSKPCGAISKVYISWGEPPLKLCTTCYLEMIKGHSMVPYKGPKSAHEKRRINPEVSPRQMKRGERLLQNMLNKKR